MNFRSLVAAGSAVLAAASLTATVRAAELPMAGPDVACVFDGKCGAVSAADPLVVSVRNTVKDLAKSVAVPLPRSGELRPVPPLPPLKGRATTSRGGAFRGMIDGVKRGFSSVGDFVMYPADVFHKETFIFEPVVGLILLGPAIGFGIVGGVVGGIAGFIKGAVGR